MPKYDNDTIAAVSTAIGEGGIGIVRLSGAQALYIADKIFIPKKGKKASDFKSHTVHYGHIVRRLTGAKTAKRKPQTEVIDEVLLTVMRAPKTYTKEDTVEINCHGGIQATKKVLDLAIKNGARMAEPGEFTKRAFLNGRLDLSQAEAVLDTIRAKTEASLKSAMDQLGGGLSRRVDSLIEVLSDMLAQIEASIDFPDEDIEPKSRKKISLEAARASEELRALIESHDKGMIIRGGVLAIICGKPNVGKSSLMNLLLKRDRVIVSPIPGTTRDAVEETVDLGGVPIRLVDTAGIGADKGLLDKRSADKTRSYLALADIALVVIDASRGIDSKDKEIFRIVKEKRKLVIMNKIDLSRRVNEGSIKKLSGGVDVVSVSVSKGTNIPLLEKKIPALVWRGGFSQDETAMVATARHKELLDKAQGCMISVVKALKGNYHPELIAIDLKEAIFELGLITGRSVSDDLLDRIFEKFCVGK